MRQNQQNKQRMRGRPNRKAPNPLTRSFDSNGPDIKIRGTALHIAEKYFRPVKKWLSVLNMKCLFGKKSFIPMEAANMLQAAVFAKTMMKSMNNTIIIKIFLL